MAEMLDIEMVLKHYGVELRPGRVEQKIACPVHADNDPSCNANRDKNLIHCHACGFGGDGLKLIMEKEGLDIDDARAFAASAGFGTTEDRDGGREVLSSLFGGRTTSLGSRDRRGNRKYVPLRDRQRRAP